MRYEKKSACNPQCTPLPIDRWLVLADYHAYTCSSAVSYYAARLQSPPPLSAPPVHPRMPAAALQV
jgi:hypothetical protein